MKIIENSKKRKEEKNNSAMVQKAQQKSQEGQAQQCARVKTIDADSIKSITKDFLNENRTWDSIENAAIIAPAKSVKELFKAIDRLENDEKYKKAEKELEAQTKSDASDIRDINDSDGHRFFSREEAKKVAKLKNDKDLELPVAMIASFAEDLTEDQAIAICAWLRQYKQSANQSQPNPQPTQQPTSSQGFTDENGTWTFYEHVSMCRKNITVKGTEQAGDFVLVAKKKDKDDDCKVIPYDVAIWLRDNNFMPADYVLRLIDTYEGKGDKISVSKELLSQYDSDMFSFKTETSHNSHK